MINELNYEQYALDYIEGSLDKKTKDAMDLFFEAHPMLKEEVIAISAITLPNTHYIYEDKNHLLKKASPIKFLPIAFAISTAACIVLAVGFIYLLSQQTNYGQLANQSVQLNIDIDLPASKSIIESKPSDLKEKQHINNLDKRFYTSTSINTNTTTKSNIKAEFKTGQLSEETAQIKEFQSIVIEKENSPVIFNTVQLSALSNNLILIDEKLQREELAKNQKKEAIKQGVRSIFQNALLPEGVATVFNY